MRDTKDHLCTLLITFSDWDTASKQVTTAHTFASTDPRHYPQRRRVVHSRQTLAEVPNEGGAPLSSEVIERVSQSALSVPLGVNFGSDMVQFRQLRSPPVPSVPLATSVQQQSSAGRLINSPHGEKPTEESNGRLSGQLKHSPTIGSPPTSPFSTSSIGVHEISLSYSRADPLSPSMEERRSLPAYLSPTAHSSAFIPSGSVQMHFNAGKSSDARLLYTVGRPEAELTFGAGELVQISDSGSPKKRETFSTTMGNNNTMATKSAGDITTQPRGMAQLEYTALARQAAAGEHQKQQPRMSRETEAERQQQRDFASMFGPRAPQSQPFGASFSPSKHGPVLSHRQTRSYESNEESKMSEERGKGKSRKVFEKTTCELLTEKSVTTYGRRPPAGAKLSTAEQPKTKKEQPPIRVVQQRRGGGGGGGLPRTVHEDMNGTYLYMRYGEREREEEGRMTAQKRGRGGGGRQIGQHIGRVHQPNGTSNSSRGEWKVMEERLSLEEKMNKTSKSWKAPGGTNADERLATPLEVLVSERPFSRKTPAKIVTAERERTQKSQRAPQTTRLIDFETYKKEVEQLQKQAAELGKMGNGHLQNELLPLAPAVVVGPMGQHKREILLPQAKQPTLEARLKYFPIDELATEQRMEETGEKEEDRKRSEMEEEAVRRRMANEESMLEKEMKEREERVRRSLEREEEQRRVMKEEERMRRMVEEEQRRRMEEDKMRGIEEEEEIMQKERRRIEEEEWRRKRMEEEKQRRRMEQEKRSRMEEEEQRRTMEEEEKRRRIEEEVWKRKRMEEEKLRRVEEEEMMQKERRRIKEEEWRRKIMEEEKRVQLEELIMGRPSLIRPQPIYASSSSESYHSMEVINYQKVIGSPTEPLEMLKEEVEIHSLLSSPRPVMIERAVPVEEKGTEERVEVMEEREGDKRREGKERKEKDKEEEAQKEQEQQQEVMPTEYDEVDTSRGMGRHLLETLSRELQYQEEVDTEISRRRRKIGADGREEPMGEEEEVEEKEEEKTELPLGMENEGTDVQWAKVTQQQPQSQQKKAISTAASFVPIHRADAKVSISGEMSLPPVREEGEDEEDEEEAATFEHKMLNHGEKQRQQFQRVRAEQLNGASDVSSDGSISPEVRRVQKVGTSSSIQTLPGIKRLPPPPPPKPPHSIFGTGTSHHPSTTAPHLSEPHLRQSSFSSVYSNFPQTLSTVHTYNTMEHSPASSDYRSAISARPYFSRPRPLSPVRFSSDGGPRVLKMVSESSSISSRPLSPYPASTTASAIRDAREREKKEMSELNDRLATYIEKVRFLEAQNRKLATDLDFLHKRWGKDATNVREMFETDLRQAKKLLEDSQRQKDELEKKAKAMEEEMEAVRKKHSDAQTAHEDDKKLMDQLLLNLSSLEAELAVLKRRLQILDDDLKALRRENQYLAGETQKARTDLDQETLNRIDYQNQVQTLLEEIDFLRRAHDAEIQDLQAMASRDTTGENRELFRNELASAIREIRSDYDVLNNRNRSDIESWYKMKVQEIQTLSARQNLEQNYAKEEVKRLRTQLGELRGKLADLEGRNSLLERQAEELAYQVEDDQRAYESALNDKDAQIRKLRDEAQALMLELQMLLDTKQTLDAEIAMFRKMLEGEEDRSGLYQLVEQVVRTQNIRKQDEAESQRILRGEKSSRQSYQRSAKGNVSILETSPEGKYIVLENTHRSKEEPIGEWKLRRRIDGKHEIVYTFPQQFVLRPGKSVKIWARGHGINDPPDQLVFEGEESFGTGSNVQTLLYNRDGEERASLIQRSSGR